MPHTFQHTVSALLPDIIDLYKNFHAHPELSLQETWTSETIARRLATLKDYSVTTELGKTGVLGILQNGPGPTVALRADMDALPIEEKTGLPYASTVQMVDLDGNTVPVMHACGHDAHVAALLGAAQVLAEQKEQWSGTLMLIFQPAEETLAGARAMLDDGMFKRFPKPDVLLGQHTGSFQAGTLSHMRGISGQASMNYRVRIFGKGGHGAVPTTTIDPIVIAAAAIMRLQTIVSREMLSTTFPVVTVGAIHSGTKANVIPEEATLLLTLRSTDNEALRQIEEAVRRTITLEAQIARAPREPLFEVIAHTPVLHNDDPITDRVIAAHRKHFGEPQVMEILQTEAEGSEDFGELAIARPGRFDGPNIPYCYWNFGTTSADSWAQAKGDDWIAKARTIPGVHTPYFAPDPEPALRTAIEALTVAALEFLESR